MRLESGVKEPSPIRVFLAYQEDVEGRTDHRPGEHLCIRREAVDAKLLQPSPQLDHSQPHRVDEESCRALLKLVTGWCREFGQLAQEAPERCQQLTLILRKVTPCHLLN